MNFQTDCVLWAAYFKRKYTLRYGFCKKPLFPNVPLNTFSTLGYLEYYRYPKVMKKWSGVHSESSNFLQNPYFRCSWEWAELQRLILCRAQNLTLICRRCGLVAFSMRAHYGRNYKILSKNYEALNQWIKSTNK